ncbi:MAG TPA: hypothetical protein VG943_17780 [Caulobacterales bacterium]|nr:hypothetical protein [Caulobacterales bacterium]
MRRLALVSLLALALSACGQNAQKQAAAPAPTPPAASLASAFPDLFQANYRVEANLTHRDGAATPIVLIRAGQKTRVEMANDAGPVVMIMNGDGGDALMIINRAGQRMALRMNSPSFEDVAAEWRDRTATNAHAVGPCSAAGENGTEWERQDQSGDTGSVCVTNDGIILRATKNGRTVWETTRVQRGPQDAALFAAPPGVRVMQLGAGAQAMLERMQAKKP